MKTEIEDAIESLEILKIFDAPELARAVKMAAAALRAQQTQLDRSKWEGCHICNSEFPVWYLIGCHADYEPNFCPNCGRPLTEEGRAKLERRIGGNDGKIDK